MVRLIASQGNPCCRGTSHPHVSEPVNQYEIVVRICTGCGQAGDPPLNHPVFHHVW
jgi:hypothetical protein